MSIHIEVEGPPTPVDPMRGYLRALMQEFAEPDPPAKITRDEMLGSDWVLKLEDVYFRTTSTGRSSFKGPRTEAYRMPFLEAIGRLCKGGALDDFRLVLLRDA